MQLPVDTRADAGYSAEPITLRGQADGAGNLTLTTRRPVAEGQRWLIAYIVLTCDAGAPTADLYADTADLPNLLDGTDDASAALAEYNPPRALRQGQVLVIVFSAATPGANCSVRIEYDVETG